MNNLNGLISLTTAGTDVGSYEGLITTLNIKRENNILKCYGVMTNLGNVEFLCLAFTKPVCVEINR